MKGNYVLFSNLIRDGPGLGTSRPDQALDMRWRECGGKRGERVNWVDLEKKGK